MNLVLVGFMASGKTSVGRRVAKRLGFRFLDTDQFIEAEQGCSIKDIFSYQGEPYFRGLETDLLRRLVHFEGYVFATGGGILTTPGNLDLLRQMGVVVFLDTNPEEIIQRLEHDTARPNAQAEDRSQRVLELLEQRLPQYQQSDLVIKNLGKTPNQTAGEVIRRFADYTRSSGGSAAQC